jgi:hypothetical protein
MLNWGAKYMLTNWAVRQNYLQILSVETIYFVLLSMRPLSVLCIL